VPFARPHFDEVLNAVDFIKSKITRRAATPHAQLRIAGANHSFLEVIEKMWRDIDAWGCGKGIHIPAEKAA
jgi:hypothetical protein